MSAHWSTIATFNSAATQGLAPNPNPALPGPSPASPPGPSMVPPPGPSMVDQQKKQQKEQRRHVALVKGGLRAASTAMGKVDDKAAGIATPGGIGGLLAILFLFWLAIIPLNGKYTRLHLFWLTLTGRAALPTQATGSPDWLTSAEATGAAAAGYVGSTVQNVAGVVTQTAFGVGGGPLAPPSFSPIGGYQ